LYTGNDSTSVTDSKVSGSTTISKSGQIFSQFISPDLFLQKYGISNLQTKLQSAVSNLSDDNISSDSNINTVPSYKGVTDYISNVNTNDIPTIKFMINCIKESKATPDLQGYEEAKHQLAASKQRLEQLLHPEDNVSYYEGWFPTTRPLRESSLFILFGLALFILLLAIILLIRRQGVQVNVATSPAYDSAVNSVYETVKGYGFLSIGAGILIGYLIHIYRKK
jgi:hypothetical protein